MRWLTLWCFLALILDAHTGATATNTQSKPMAIDGVASAGANEGFLRMPGLGGGSALLLEESLTREEERVKAVEVSLLARTSSKRSYSYKLSGADRSLFVVAAIAVFVGVGALFWTLYTAHKAHQESMWPSRKTRGKPLGNIVEAWYINLNDKTERRAKMDTQLAEAQLTHERFEGIRLRTLQDALDHPRLKGLLDKTPSFQYDPDCRDHPTEPLERRASFVLSVFLSHLAAYRSLGAKHGGQPSANPYDAVLVLEDDTIVPTNLQERFQAVADYLPEDWEVLRLGVWGASSEEDAVNEVIHRATPPFWDTKAGTVRYGGAHAVAIRVSAASTVVEKLQRSHLDDIDAVLTNNNEIESYCINPDHALVSVNGAVGGSENPVFKMKMEAQIKEWTDYLFNNASAKPNAPPENKLTK